MIHANFNEILAFNLLIDIIICFEWNDIHFLFDEYLE